MGMITLEAVLGWVLAFAVAAVGLVALSILFAALVWTYAWRPLVGGDQQRVGRRGRVRARFQRRRSNGLEAPPTRWWVADLGRSRS